MAAVSGIVDGCESGLRSLLQHQRIRTDRDADVSTGPAFKEPQRPEQRRQSTHVGQWIQFIRWGYANHICRGSGVSHRVCAKLADIDSAGFARGAGDDGHVSWNQGNARRSDVSAKYVSRGGSEPVPVVSRWLCIPCVKWQFDPRIGAASIAAKIACGLHVFAAVHVFEVNRRRRDRRARTGRAVDCAGLAALERGARTLKFRSAAPAEFDVSIQHRNGAAWWWASKRMDLRFAN